MGGGREVVHIHTQTHMENLTASAIKDAAFEVGRMLESSQIDEDGRILINPILNYIRSTVGKECRMSDFLKRNSALLENLSEVYDSKELVKVEQGGGGGTW